MLRYEVLYASSQLLPIVLASASVFPMAPLQKISNSHPARPVAWRENSPLCPPDFGSLAAPTHYCKPGSCDPQFRDPELQSVARGDAAGSFLLVGAIGNVGWRFFVDCEL